MTLELTGLSCGYGNRAVVQDFSARVVGGEIFCLLGANGIGKTTLLRTVMGFLPPLGGHVTLDGADVASFSRRDLARLIAYVPQSHGSAFAYTVGDMVNMGFNEGGTGVRGKDRAEAVRGIMDLLGMRFSPDRVYTELSGGEQQLVLIARALAQEPAFLVMDEPLSGLDLGNQALVLEQIRHLAGRTLGVLFTSHDPSHGLHLGCTAALILKDGRAVIGEAKEVLTAEHLFLAFF
jgi:iron complex transport system ATP-binding protein